MFDGFAPPRWRGALGRGKRRCWSGKIWRWSSFPSARKASARRLDSEMGYQRMFLSLLRVRAMGCRGRPLSVTQRLLLGSPWPTNEKAFFCVTCGLVYQATESCRQKFQKSKLLTWQHHLTDTRPVPRYSGAINVGERERKRGPRWLLVATEDSRGCISPSP